MTFKDNIERVTSKNKAYRRVLYTTPQMQLVVMRLQPGQEIGMESHSGTTQFIRVEGGRGTAIVAGKTYRLKDGDALVIPPRARHNIMASKHTELELYTIYSPPEHSRGTLQYEKVRVENMRE